MIAIFIFVVGLTVLVFYKLFNRPRKCKSNVRLDGKTVIITGCTSGIGKVTALELARRGARVIMACRNVLAAREVKTAIERDTGNTQLTVHGLDLESLASVREFSKVVHDTETRVDILINNAGCGGLGDAKTVDGFNVTLQVNHLAPFLLANLLVDLLLRAAPSRVVTVSSRAHLFALLNLKDLNQHRTLCSLDFIDYANAKLCSILASSQMAWKLRGTGVTVNSLHPGSINTNLFRHTRYCFKLFFTYLASWFLLTPEQGAQTTLHCALSEDLDGVSGKYFANCQIDWRRRPAVHDRELAAQIWTISEQLVNLEPHERLFTDTYPTKKSPLTLNGSDVL